MAKRSKKRPTHRRRRMGAPKTSELISTVSIVIGAMGAAIISKMVGDKVSEQTKALAAIGIGIGLPMFIKQKAVANIATGVAAYGGIELLKSTNLISGPGTPVIINRQPAFPAERLNGTGLGMYNTHPTLGANPVNNFPSTPGLGRARKHAGVYSR